MTKKRLVKKEKKKRINKIKKEIEKIENLKYYFVAGTFAQKQGFFNQAYKNFKKGERKSPFREKCIDNLYILTEIVSPKKDLYLTIIGKREEKEKKFKEKNNETGLTADQIMELRAKNYEDTKENKKKEEYEDIEPLRLYGEKYDKGNWNKNWGNKVNSDLTRPLKKLEEKTSTFPYKKLKAYN